MSTTTRILIVDDHPLVCAGLHLLFATEADLHVCGEAAGAPAALMLAKATQPDLVIVDLSLSEGTDLELIADLRQQFPKVKILVCSVQDEFIYAERALRAGASGYVDKTASIRVLLDAIRQVLAGEIYASPEIKNRLLDYVSSGRPELNALDRLSNREFQVFEWIGKGLSGAQIAKHLFLSPKTVSTYCDGIKTKLNLASASALKYHAIQWALSDCRVADNGASPTQSGRA